MRISINASLRAFIMSPVDCSAAQAVSPTSNGKQHLTLLVSMSSYLVLTRVREHGPGIVVATNLERKRVRDTRQIFITIFPFSDLLDAGQLNGLNGLPIVLDAQRVHEHGPTRCES